MSVIALIVAGGSGTRLQTGRPKQYQHIGNTSLIERAISRFEDHIMIDKVVVVIKPEHEELYNTAIPKHLKKEFTYGGSTRQESVFNGLKYIQKYKPEKVLIHDAARPFTDSNLISRVIEELSSCDAVDIALPITDTVKSIKDGSIDILNREHIYRSQTPQGFDYQNLLNLHNKYQKDIFTDDISLFAKEGLEIGQVTGSINNIKITYPEDLKYAEYLVMRKI